MSASPLALKILGAGAIAAVGTGGIVLHQTGFFKTTNNQKTSPSKNQLKNSLFTKLNQTGLKFTVTGGDGITKFPATNEKLVTFETNINNLTWKCKIKFKNTTNSEITWNTEQKDIFDKDKTGFLQRIKSPGNDYESTKEKFIEKCFSSSKINSPEETFELEKEFTLNGQKFNDDFDVWFKNDSLSEEEKTALESGTLTLTADDKSNPTKLTISSSTSDKKPSDCIINLLEETKTNVKTKLEEKFNSTNGQSINDEHKRYRRGFFKKCKNNENQLTIRTPLSNTNLDISSLFDFSDETNSDNDLKNGTWAVEIDTASQTNTSSILFKVTKSGETPKEVCKVIGFKENGETTKLEKTKTSMKSSLETKINNESDKDTLRENFLNRCRRTWDNTIKLELIEGVGDSYTLQDLDAIFS